MNELSSLIVDEFSKRADDMTFVSTVFSDADLWPPKIQPKVWRQVAMRMLELGFSEKAYQIMLAQVGAESATESQLLLAQIELQLSDHEAALQRVSTLTDPRADRIRAAGREKLGDNDIAYMMFNAAGEDDSAIRNARLSDNWNEIVDESDPIFGPAKQINDALLPSTNTEPDMLENLSNLVGESQNARNAISSMLQRAVVDN